jgi:AraC-like DNA-binding protein
MYYPTQIPYILNKEFSEHMRYSEEAADACGGLIICFWEMRPISGRRLTVSNIVAADGCIDLVVNYDEGTIGFAGMSKTVFDFKHELPTRSFGARMMPGTFHQLTGLPATVAMNTFLPVQNVYPDFERESFFALPYDPAKDYFKAFLTEKTSGQTPNAFSSLFPLLSENLPDTTALLYQMLHFSPRQCQRLFMKHYGISPKMVLSIVRFQRCLEILTSSKATPADILSATNYYDQPHFINDFKRNMGITPLEFIRIYQT